MNHAFFTLALLLSVSMLHAAPSLSVEGLAGNIKITGQGGKSYVLLRLKGLQAPKTERAPLNLGVVIDRSGSMAGEKLESVKKAALQAIEMLDGEKDRVSLTIYDDRVACLYPAQKLDKRKLSGLIKEITDGNSTALHAGMTNGVEETKKNVSDKNVSRVLLLSDGLANEGVTDPEIIGKDARKAFESGVTITTLGVGNDYNENLMVDIAKKGHGNYYFIESPKQIERIFQKEFSSLLSLVAKDILIRITPGKGVKVLRVIGFDYSGGQIEVNPVYGGGEAYFLFELMLPPGQGKFGAFEAEAVYLDLSQNKKESAKVATTVEYVKDAADPLENRDVYTYFVDLDQAEKLDRITKTLDQGKNDDAKNLAKQQIQELKAANGRLKSKKVEEDIEKLEKQLAGIESLGSRNYQESEEGRSLKKAVQADSYDKSSK